MNNENNLEQKFDCEEKKNLKYLASCKRDYSGTMCGDIVGGISLYLCKDCNKVVFENSLNMFCVEQKPEWGYYTGKRTIDEIISELPKHSQHTARKFLWN